MKLSYKLWNKTGNPDLNSTPKIVLLHGMGGTGSLWRPLASSLEDKMAVLAPDQRGHGKSQISEKTQYTPLDYGRDTVETLLDLKFSPTWILGHSMGVRSAVATAHLRPDLVKGLILIDLGLSGVAGGGLGDGLAQFLKKVPMKFSSRDEARDYMTQHCPDPSIGQYLMAVSVKTEEGLLTFPFDRTALIQTIEAAEHVSVRDWALELAQKKMPILVLRGENSLVWSHQDFEAEKNHFKEFEQVKFKEVSNAGHGLPFEQRLTLIQMIEDLVLR